MKIAVPMERRPGELRVAVSPEVAAKLVGLGFTVAVEKGAGAGASFLDAAYKKAGATIAKDAASTLKGADVVLKVQGPITQGAEGENETQIIEQPLPRVQIHFK